MPITSYAQKNHEKLEIIPYRLEHLEKKLQSWIDDGSSQAINIRVLKSGMEIFNGSYGKLSPNGENLTQDAIFPIASITKPTVAALLLQLQEDGDIDLYLPVADYLPSFGQNGKGDICVHHLLSHTSGLDEDSFFDGVFAYAKEKFDMTAPKEGCEWDELKEFCKNLCGKIGLDCTSDNAVEQLNFFLPAKHTSGTVMSYNTFGYDVALKIAGKVTGKSADELAYGKLFAPLGMVDSHYILPTEKHKRLIIRGEGYMGYPWFNDCFNWDNGGSGLKSTTADILKFMEMLRLGGTYNGNRILSPLSVKLMTQNHNKQLDCFSSWTLGFNCYGGKLNDTGMMRSSHTIDHGGAMQSYVRTDFENDLSFVYFSAMKNDTPLRRPLVANMVMSAIA